MQLESIVSMLKIYLLRGGVMAVGALTLFCIGYFVIYKKLMKGKGRLTKGKVLWALVFGCYLFVILSATLLDRGSHSGGGKVVPLFYSYREAWRSFSAILWRNLALNILMFVPFGFLLPLGVKRLGNFWKTYLAGFLLAALIELAQLAMRRGEVEMDDIFNNLLGTMIGYGCYAIARGMIRRVRSAGAARSAVSVGSAGAVRSAGHAASEKPHIGQVFLLQLPLVGTLAAFGILFLAYNGQELGNLQEECIAAYDAGLLDFSSDVAYSQETGLLPVYQVQVKTKEEAVRQATDFFAVIGEELDERQTDAYEYTVFCYSTGRKMNLTVQYAGGTYSFVDFELQKILRKTESSAGTAEGTAANGPGTADGRAETKISRVEDAAESEVREALKSYGISLPEAAVFENRGDGVYALGLKQHMEDGIFYDGVLSCTYYNNGRMETINNRILECMPYKLFEVISESEAYAKLSAGVFENGYYAADTALKGEIGTARLSYSVDSKGFYQPVYEFEAVINGKECSFVIPAVRDKNGGQKMESWADADKNGGQAMGSGGDEAGPQGGHAEPEEFATVAVSRVTVHDPSVVYDNGTYYIFGSHMAWAKSTDLMNWKYFQTNINTEYAKLFGSEWESWCKTTSNPELRGNLWAPDVIYNKKMGKYCLYMSVNGDDWNSVIVMLTADHIEGPYEYGGPVVYSGFNTGAKHPAELTDVYRVLGEGADLGRYQSTDNTKLNCIDPCLTYDEEGNLWMSYGSWFGGIYQLKLDEETGLRDYGTVYETVENVSDAYYGHKIAGGRSVSGEGSFIIRAGGYYYLFLSYGGLTAAGGYQIRVFRSEDINGPYVDQAGNTAVYEKPQNNLFVKKGVRLMGSYDWTGNREIRVAQGHNSAYVTEEGQIFLVYHSRFAGGKNGIPEAHEVRVQQLFVNDEGWLVAAPYEYAGETISGAGYTMEEMCGGYEFLLHEPTEYYRKYGKEYKGIEQAVRISLNADGTVTGELSGSWSYEKNSPCMSITIEGVTYRGVFLKMPSEQLFEDEKERRVVMTFTALGDNITVWGSK